MNTVLILGGKLQGVDAVYLMKKAGWKTIVVDKKKDVPASNMADVFLNFDILNKEKLENIMKTVDFIIPALENELILDVIYEEARHLNKVIMFSPSSYKISCSKIKSDKLFERLEIPAPKYWPNCEFPIIVKPSNLSGSEKVFKFYNKKDFEEFFKINGSKAKWVIQEYLEGPSYSIEIIAKNGIMKTFQVTELEMDEFYDCKRVLCPSLLPTDLEKIFSEYASKLAEAVALDGIMDVEVILSNGKLKVLEIDARIPSQTLSAVYKSTKIVAPNVYFGDLKSEDIMEFTNIRGRGVVYEHILVTENKIKVCGEHIMGINGPLKHVYNFFGSDEALTNYEPNKKSWVATLIISDENREKAWKKHLMVIEQIKKIKKIDIYEDLYPIG